MSQSNKKIYQGRIDHFASLLSKTERITKNISFLRLVIFIIAFIAVYYFARIESTPGIVLSIFITIAVFVFLVRLHGKFLLKKNLEKAHKVVNTLELKAIQGNIDQFDNGVEFNSPEHYYVNDLDIFGPGSLFQFLNRTASFTGLNQLAKLLSNPYSDAEKIKQSQLAVKELKEQLDWRQNFQSIGLAYEEDKDDRAKIESWSESKPLFSSIIFKLIIVVVPVLTLFMITLLSMGSITVQIFLMYLLIPWGIAGSFAMKVNTRHNQVSKTSEMLNKYALLLQEIEQLEVQSDELNKLKQKVIFQENRASKSIKALSAILTALDNRLNFVSWALLNGLFVWDILQMIRLEAWQKKHQRDIHNWFEVVGQIDVISCFANFYYNSYHAVFPELVADRFEVIAKGAGHPLIDSQKRVDNDITVLDGEFVIITGANMAGKSTYLRTIGVNLILAMCGAPVCATSFSFTPVQIFTSIRTVDSLKENESYFYAELKRLKSIIDTLRDGNKLFIILDEILKGTNSKDKHAGSEALLRQLVSLNSSGIVATHDVLLGKMSDDFPDNIKNQCFEVEIEGNKLNFDYLLREGVSKNLNATILMREMGITI